MKKIVYLLFIFCGSLFAQKDSLATISLNEIELKSVRLNTTLNRFPAALVQKKIDVNYAGSQQSLQEYIEDLPGIISFNRTNFAQDLRLSIRGFGARSAFGIRGIKLVVDGIPETTPDGQGQLDNLPLAVLSSIELVRGPNSLRFGNAAGGVLYLNTLEKIDKSFNTLALQQGSFGQQNYQLTGGVKGEHGALIYHASHAKSNGYRDHSSFSTSLVNVKYKHRLNAHTSLVVQLNATNSPKAQDAGGQTLDEYNTARSSARDRNIQFDAGERIAHFKSGVHLDHQKGSNHFQYYAFMADRNFEGRLPFNSGGWINLDRSYTGHGGSFAKTLNLHALELNSQVGYAYGRQTDIRSRYLNNNGEQGEQTLNQREFFHSIGAYFIQHINYLNWTLNAGVRWDNNTLGVNDYFTSDGVNSATKKLEAFSPQIGLSYAFSPRFSLFVNHSKSYETPSLSELSADPNGAGGFNDALEIQKANNREVGVNFYKNSTKISLVYFDILTENDLVPYRLADFPGRTFYRNAGSTSRSGFEFLLAYRFSEKWSSQLTWNNGEFTYVDYENNGTNYNGKKLPGVPTTFGQWNINFYPKKDWQLRYARTYRGKLSAQDSNETTLNSFWRDDLSLRIPVSLSEQKLNFLFGANNIFNVAYSDNVRINAFGGRFYEAAPRKEIYASLRWQF